MTKLEERKAAAEARMNELAKLEETKQKAKDDVQAGKAKLRQVQDIDAAAKK